MKKIIYSLLSILLCGLQSCVDLDMAPYNQVSSGNMSHGYQRQKLVEKKEIAVETRGMGLMRGLELSVPAGPYITKALEKGVIFMSAGANVIRFIPPLIFEKSDVDKMIAILDSVLDD